MDWTFLSTLSLRRATQHYGSFHDLTVISIHALLAESDWAAITLLEVLAYFYPRSPCGERPGQDYLLCCKWSDFYPRSPCGERLACPIWNPAGKVISIHALLAESDRWLRKMYFLSIRFLSTLSLRRATSPTPGVRF